MLITIDPESAVPLATQVAAQLRRQIVEGAVAAGERLPAARELAASLGINMHTVLRAYDIIRAAGLIELRRGRGAIVLGDARQTQSIYAEASALVTKARRLGIDSAELATIIRGMS
ncbi:GntR family transcriptional regulator [Lacisediminihabitans changchengi]|uniref:GntR family transcriptional regulator n=1 Tax=Lacisediminihabitans changchengi TaxID=2787634 RepID=A0A934SSK4_9MICO|nr:GntR family transcriptional regulator [Lacisediminihabitans changchengi]MBK4348218.1 GntR family transcriptional regulator [Lacisediminihabitans changchengi]